MAERSEYVFRGKLLTLKLLHTPRGIREIVEHPGAAAVLVVDEAGRVLLVRQLREAVGRELWEIPAGKLEPGEYPELTAQRELQEETGLVAGRLTYLGVIYPTPGYSNERIYLFAAEELKGEARAASEVSEARFFSVEEALRLAFEGQGDGKTLAALALYLDFRGRAGRLPRLG